MPRHTANFLTFLRLFLIPLVVLSFYMNSPTWRLIAALSFIFGCITDYLDGYIARTFSQVSRLGQFLDPIADKLLVASTLFMLAGFGRISTASLVPAIIILSREIFISSFRSHLQDFAVTLQVSHLAKWKTAIQMIAICCLLVGDTIEQDQAIHQCGEILLWIASTLAVVTAYSYVRDYFRYL